MDADLDFSSYLPGMRSPQDQGLFAEFYWHPVKNGARSQAEGRDIYEERVYVLIIAKGQRNTELRREAKDKDKQRFAREWAAFEAKKQAPLSGTPLDSMPGLSASRIKELEYFHIRTVEDLAGLGDNVLGNLGMDARKLRDRAKAWITGSGSLARTAQLEARIVELERLLADASSDKPRRGRPPKNEPADPDTSRLPAPISLAA